MIGIGGYAASKRTDTAYCHCDLAGRAMAARVKWKLEQKRAKRMPSSLHEFAFTFMFRCFFPSRHRLSFITEWRPNLQTKALHMHVHCFLYFSVIATLKWSSHNFSHSLHRCLTPSPFSFLCCIVVYCTLAHCANVSTKNLPRCSFSYSNVVFIQLSFCLSS